jgi:hypothetical protein
MKMARIRIRNKLGIKVRDKGRQIIIYPPLSGRIYFYRNISFKNEHR